VAESRQFGSPKVLQFGDKTAGNQPGDSGHCAQCEAMLADALDGTLSAADQQVFDEHMAECGPCSQMLADARRGAAWLEMLRTPAPEPPVELLERILAITSGIQTYGTQPIATHAAGVQQLLQPQQGVPAPAPGYAVQGAAFGNVVPLRQRAAAAVRASSFGPIMFQPRLAMTAAMAFFSIALTMNLTGVHPLSLRASDLSPSSLKRDFYSANARVVQYYEGLRVVYELESRVHDLQSTSDSDAPAARPATLEKAVPGSTVRPGQPGVQTPAAQPGKPGPTGQTPAAQPEQKQRPPASGPGAGAGAGPASRLAPNSSSNCHGGIGRPTSLMAEYNRVNVNRNIETVEGSLV